MRKSGYTAFLRERSSSRAGRSPTTISTVSLLGCKMTGKTSRLRKVLISLGAIVGLAFVLAFVVALMLPFVGNARETYKRVVCSNNLKQIAAAMRAYCEAHGRFPPAYTVDANGRPMHSWRVLILPWLGEKALYDQYDLREPWDSLQNQAVTARMPAVFRCPADKKAPGGETNYAMVVGPGTVSNGTASCKLEDIRDGTDQTILVVEVVDSGIHWAEPRDLNVEGMSFQINSPGGKDISSRHSVGRYDDTCVVFCDESVHYLYTSIDPAVIKALITIAGGEKVPDY
jgi:hypothetical protein